jgi:hypothetical protein
MRWIEYIFPLAVEGYGDFVYLVEGQRVGYKGEPDNLHSLNAKHKSNELTQGHRRDRPEIRVNNGAEHAARGTPTSVLSKRVSFVDVRK